MRIVTIGACLLAIAPPAWAAAVATGPMPAASAATTTIPLGDIAGTDVLVVTDAEDAANKLALVTAAQLIRDKQPQFAIGLLDKLIPKLEARHANPGKQVYCAHTQVEALAYLAAAAAATPARDAVATASTYCDAVYFRGFANVDLGKPAAAEADFTRALALSPNNPHYLSEMGELQSGKHDWEAALGYYRRAVDAAPVFSVEGQANAELGRALRGIGYVDVELGRLDEAEAQYRRCLEIDSHDEKAQGELGYVLALKQKK